MKINDKKNISKTEYAFRVIHERILQGVYEPGDRIVIDQIAKELKISHIPVREALRQLEADGLVSYKQNIGPVVQSFNEKEFSQVMVVLAILEAYATATGGLALLRGSIKKLEKINADSKIAINDFDFEEYGRLNHEFHAVILEQCGNAYLQELIQQAWQRLTQTQRTVFMFIPKRSKSSLEEHEKLVEMFKNKASAEELEAFARNHRMNTIKAIQERKRTI
ncbi:GntR family transcriptional regulator [Sporomusa sp. KB1]|jgi:DNA-binding GntR family transcriptional regulator|uniref:GntR family transcriptional regulator n=1 Tax=Sporomusa sp. KB1 TaxID=943346 RepID=UPI0011A6330E|nr:GntR family transcriptional regulator [Sporomusa sp. KB1]TWH52023.1 DNA-binding GntR family transcriptional regulator [Sporomusa sp. KB1]